MTVEVLVNFAMTDFASQGKCKELVPYEDEKMWNPIMVLTPDRNSREPSINTTTRHLWLKNIPRHNSWSARPFFPHLWIFLQNSLRRQANSVHSNVMRPPRNNLLHFSLIHQSLHFILSFSVFFSTYSATLAFHSILFQFSYNFPTLHL